MMEWRVPLHEVVNNWTDEQLQLMFEVRQRRLDKAKAKEASQKMRPWKMPSTPPPPPSYWKNKKPKPPKPE